MIIGKIEGEGKKEQQEEEMWLTDALFSDGELLLEESIGRAGSYFPYDEVMIVHQNCRKRKEQ